MFFWRFLSFAPTFHSFFSMLIFIVLNHVQNNSPRIRYSKKNPKPHESATSFEYFGGQQHDKWPLRGVVTCTKRIIINSAQIRLAYLQVFTSYYWNFKANSTNFWISVFGSRHIKWHTSHLIRLFFNPI